VVYVEDGMGAEGDGRNQRTECRTVFMRLRVSGNRKGGELYNAVM